jgi:transposase InsO family protein
MGRIDIRSGPDLVMERRHINAMLRNFEEYESIKSKQHKTFSTVGAFFETKGICKQNFHKYYRRFIHSKRDINSLIPHRTGRKFKEIERYTPELIENIKLTRSKGYNRYDLCAIIRREYAIEISPSSIYRLMKKLNINKLNYKIKEEKRKIVKTHSGELGHIDIHYVTKGTVKETGSKKLYILGLIDDHSRICWLEVIDSIKAIDVMFASMDILMRLKSRYNIQFKEIMSDNGSEFSSRNNPDHPFEKLLTFYGIKHRYTLPFRPQTNGKIERFWRTLEDELLSGEVFDTLEEFKHYLQGYVLYYNEHRNHQGIGNQIPNKNIYLKEELLM